tara:strand:- start:3449 stop:6391 length:2943 start_codon:yes stop_codon:yes gene_type:complete
MKKQTIVSSLILALFCFVHAEQFIPLSKKSHNETNAEADYYRGTYLIILADSQLEEILINPNNVPVYGDNFVSFKRSQGFDVDIVSLDEENLTEADSIRSFLRNYYEQNPALEYVLLVGDINGSYEIPPLYIQSINEDEIDVTDYPYTFFNNDPNSEDYDILDPKYFLGRWTIRNQGDLINAKIRSIEYVKMSHLNGDTEYLENALLVAGNYKTNDGQEVPPETWPVTPVWTSLWLMDQLLNFGYTRIDTAFFHMDNQSIENPLIVASWTDGVGIINYRGWGNSHGWHRPSFYIEDINSLNHGWQLPIVFSFVCNTGDFGADQYNNGPVKCFGEELITKGTPSNPKGAAAVIGPSDLDTDTKYNNVICGAIWDELLEGRQAELGPVLFIGKQSLIYEFPQDADPGGVVEFYHHIYGVLGDPSIPVWIGQPGELQAEIESSPQLHQSFLETVVSDENGYPLEDVVGVLMLNGEIIGKNLSLNDGSLSIDFDGIAVGTEIELFLNKPQFKQRRVLLTFVEDDGTPFDPLNTAEFDVSPILASNSSYIEANGSMELGLQITNLSNTAINNVTVTMTDVDTGLVSPSFSEETFSINPFSSVETGTVVSGTVGNFSKGSRLRFNAQFNIGGEMIGENLVTLLVGPIENTDPLPPCNYGYWAYDNFDTGYSETPVYDWEDINPENDGEGINLNLTDDTYTNIEIGFPFQYFGNSYETITVCSNGWISFEPCNIAYFWNFSIPMAMGPSALVAPFMDDLDDNNGTEEFNVFSWNDDANGRLILQWDDVANGEDDEFCPNCVRETFQMMLYDPSVNPTLTGDGEIVFQYLEINDIDANGNYATVGIESPNQNDGLQYLFNTQLAPGANTVTNGLSIKFTTDPPPNAIMNIEPEKTPSNFLMVNNYPNPFNMEATIEFSLSMKEKVTLVIYDILGREIKTLLNNQILDGSHSVIWNGLTNADKPVGTGVYLYRLSAGNQFRTGKMVLLK